MKKLITVMLILLFVMGLLNLVELIAQILPWAGIVILPFIMGGLLWEAIKGWNSGTMAQFERVGEGKGVRQNNTGTDLPNMRERITRGGVDY